MNIIIEGSGAITTIETVPDSILYNAYPYMSITDSPDGGLWFEVSPYFEVYDENKIREFLLSLLPYHPSGNIRCMLIATSGEHKVCNVGKWSFEFSGGNLFRSVEGSGSFVETSCISAKR